MIVPTRLNHIRDILEIEDCFFDKPWTKKQFVHDLQLVIDSENWVYLMNKRVAGYIFGWIIMEEFHLNNIAVHQDYQRKKIGKRLIQHVIEKVVLRNIRVILLEVSANNIPAQKCYKSLGFTQWGIRKDYYSKGDDAILYYLDLIKNG